jgi:lipoprotein signal peptidase
MFESLSLSVEIVLILIINYLCILLVINKGIAFGGIIILTTIFYLLLLVIIIIIIEIINLITYL